MEPADLLDLISELGCLHGFPRTDARAMLTIAESLMGLVTPKPEPVPKGEIPPPPPADYELMDRAERIVRHVVRTAPRGWQGPDQFAVAQAEIAERLHKWDQPKEWTKITPTCDLCLDTGAVQTDIHRPFELCSCANGQTDAARLHIETLNATLEAARKVREKARAQRDQAKRAPHGRIAAGLVLIESHGDATLWGKVGVKGDTQ